MLLLALAPPLATEATSMVSYVHVATNDNISGPSDELTELDHPLLNDNPDARLLVTHNWNPPGGAGVYNDHPVGVVYYASYSGGGSWFIKNQDSSSFIVGAAFNVLILGPDTLSFVHLTTDDNSAGRASYLHPIDPDCLLCPGGTKMLFTHTQTVFGIAGGEFDYHASLLYGSPSYAIVTESRFPGYLEPMPAGILFNVLIADSPDIASSPGSAFAHAASAGNIAYDWTALSHPALDGNPHAVVFVTRTGPPLVNSPHEIGVWYTEAGQWAIYFEDGADMVADSTYNVYIPPIMTDGLESGDLGWWSDAVGVAPSALPAKSAQPDIDRELDDVVATLSTVRAPGKR